MNYAKIVRAHSLDKLKLFHHLAKLKVVDRNQIKIAFNSNDVYNDWKEFNEETSEYARTLKGLSQVKVQANLSENDALSEQTANFLNLSKKRNFISSFYMADLIELRAK